MIPPGSDRRRNVGNGRASEEQAVNGSGGKGTRRAHELDNSVPVPPMSGISVRNSAIAI